jgi:Tol biopolymer transport system component
MVVDLSFSKCISLRYTANRTVIGQIAQRGKSEMDYRRFLLFWLLLVGAGVTPLYAQGSNQSFTFVRDGDIVLLDVASGEETNLLTDVNPEQYQNVWSPDGNFLAFNNGQRGDDALSIFDTRSNEVYQIEVVPERMVGVFYNCHWSADSHWLACTLYFGDPEIEAEVYQFGIIEAVPDGQVFVFSDRYPFLGIYWLPDNQRVIYGGQTGYYRFDVSTGVEVPLPLPKFDHPSLSPDGTQMLAIAQALYIGQDDQVMLFDVETGDSQRFTAGRDIRSVRFSPDGQWIGDEWHYSLWGSRISVSRLDGTEYHIVVAIEGEPDYWQWSPDSTMIAYTEPYLCGSDMCKALQAASVNTDEVWTVTDDFGRLWWWSPDSQWMAYTTDNAIVIASVFTDATLTISGNDYAIGWRP